MQTLAVVELKVTGGPEALALRREVGGATRLGGRAAKLMVWFALAMVMDCGPGSRRCSWRCRPGRP